MFSNFFIFPFVKEKIKVKLALAIPTGAPKPVIKSPPFLAVKTIKIFYM